MIYLGIDPGLSGGFAAVDRLGNPCILPRKMPDTERDVFLFFRSQFQASLTAGLVRAMLEHVSASPQMGVTSAFTFGKGYGGLRMALLAVGMPFDEVSPIRWQNAMSCRTGGDKNVSKRRAQELFPNISVTHAIADALLIAEYGRRLHLGLFTQSARERIHGQEKGTSKEGARRQTGKG